MYHLHINPHTNMKKKLTFLNMRGPHGPRWLTRIITVCAAIKVLRGLCGPPNIRMRVKALL